MRNFPTVQLYGAKEQFMGAPVYRFKPLPHGGRQVRPDGKNLVCIAENETDGYRINYSDFLCGHYIMGIQFLSQFDRAYGRQTRAEKRVKLHIKAVSDYREALEKASGLWGIPALY